MPWWGWLTDRIEELPPYVLNTILVSVALIILLFVFLPKRLKAQAIAGVLLP